jgi:hypothetical protein
VPSVQPQRVDMPDPQGALIAALVERVAALEAKLAELGLATPVMRAIAANDSVHDDVSPAL